MVTILCFNNLSIHIWKIIKEMSTPYLSLLRTFVLHPDLTVIIRGKEALQSGNQIFHICLAENDTLGKSNPDSLQAHCQ